MSVVDPRGKVGMARWIFTSSICAIIFLDGGGSILMSFVRNESRSFRATCPIVPKVDLDNVTNLIEEPLVGLVNTPRVKATGSLRRDPPPLARSGYYPRGPLYPESH